jgi:hypothetical protein
VLAFPRFRDGVDPGEDLRLLLDLWTPRLKAIADLGPTASV